MTRQAFIDKLVFHCSQSDVDAHDSIEVIRGWHVNERGWDDVGYHYFIRKNGLIEVGRDVGVMGAHVKGHNRNSIGVCLHGDRSFTEAQFSSARMLYRIFNYMIPDLQVYGHRDLDPKKTCPNFEVQDMIANT